MRNVTINAAKPDLTGTKRGRGRPRKPDALTNAQRQAAYRARKRDELSKEDKAKPAGTNSEVCALRAELSQIRDALVIEQEKTITLAKTHERQAASLRKRAALTEEELSRLKATGRSNKDGPGFEVMLQLLAMACVRKSVNAQIAIRDSDIWKKGVVRASNVTEEQMKRVSAALAGKI